MDELDETAIENFVKGYCQSKGLKLEKWKEIAEFVKERFYHYNKDSDFATLEVGKASFYEMIDCLNFQRSVIEQTIKEMDEKFLTK